jgi:uncharacterized protein (DUF305 family)
MENMHKNSAYVSLAVQTTIGNREFLRSMIPHHSGAILMCREAKLSDAELIRLCRAIQDSRRREIDEMEHILARS